MPLSWFDLFKEILHEAVKESECVALFIVCLLLLILHHLSCKARVDHLQRRMDDKGE
jgi:hypothetical protein